MANPRLNGSVPATPPQTCGGCRFWKRAPASANDLAPKSGDCRESPPGVTCVAMQTPTGQQFFSPISAYPLLPETFPACSKFAPVPITIDTE